MQKEFLINNHEAFEFIKERNRGNFDYQFGMITQE